MLVRILGEEVHFFGCPMAFNAVARIIRKSTLGAFSVLSLDAEESGYTSLEISCTRDTAAIGASENTVFIIYPEHIKNQLSTYFSMPAESYPGSVFFISRSQTGCLHMLSTDSLDIVLHVEAPRS